MNSDLVFFNQCFDKKRLKTVISWYCKNFGEEQALRMVEELKKMGFNNATQAGISIGLSDLKTPALKSFLVSEAEVVMSSTHQKFQGAEITCTEKSQRVIDTWHRASEILRKQIVDYFASTDEFNPVYIMALSGARGNFSQVRQLVGMRGLMADPQGQIISFPIRSNFREGLTLTEYFISCSGARKGLVDTALRTADTGYLTRRLVDVSHQVVVKRVACETNRGIFMKPIYSGKKMLLSLKQRLIGRVLAKDLSSVGKQDQEITPELASKIAVLNKPILVRSPLTCSFNNEVCQLCYGWSPAQGTLVSLGEAVGVIAAQSIGEPGTQLTMRTFHTGGVFSGDLLEEIKSPCDGKILFSEAFQGLLIRTAHGKIAFLTKVPGEMLLCPPDHFKKWKQSQPPTTDKRVSTSSLSGSESDLVEPKVIRNKGLLNTNFDSLNQKQKFNSVQAQNDIVKIPTFTGSISHAEPTRIGGPERSHGQIWKEVSNTKLLPISFPALTILFVRHGEDVKKNQILAEFSYFGTETNQPIKSKQTLFADFAGKIITVLGGDKKTFQQLDIIKPDKSGRLGFFFVLSASLGATFEQLRNNTQQIRLHKKQLLHTIAHQGDLVDNNYTKLPQNHSSRISSTAKIIPLGIHELKIIRRQSNESFMPGMVASSQLDYSLTKSRKDLVLPITWQNFDKRQQSFCPPVIATTSKSGGEHQRWLVVGGTVKEEKVTQRVLKNETGFLFRWNQAFTTYFTPQFLRLASHATRLLSTKQAEKKEETYFKMIQPSITTSKSARSAPKMCKNLSFSTLYQGCVNKLFVFAFLTNLQGKSIPFFSSSVGWMTITDIFRLSFLYQQTSKILVQSKAHFPFSSSQHLELSTTSDISEILTKSQSADPPFFEMVGKARSAYSKSKESWIDVQNASDTASLFGLNVFSKARSMRRKSKDTKTQVTHDSKITTTDLRDSIAFGEHQTGFNIYNILNTPLKKNPNCTTLISF